VDQLCRMQIFDGFEDLVEDESVVDILEDALAG
jgi:hypothetical protein